MDAFTLSKVPEITTELGERIDFVYGCKILLVDDQPITTDILEAMFEPLGFYTLAVNNSLLINEALQEFEPDLILLDVDMPGKTGFQISKELKSSTHFSHIPIILLTAIDDKDAVVKGLSYGVQDYVTKPFHKAELMARVINNLRLKKQQDFWRLNHTLITDQFDKRGVPRKSTFCQYLERSVARNSGSLALAVFSIYALDEIVASLKTHDARDIIYATVFERLHQDADENLFSGSLGNGKLGIIFLDVPKNPDNYLRKLQTNLEKFILIGGCKVKLKVNIGFCRSRCNAEHWHDILDKAEVALIEAGKSDTPSVVEYSPKSDHAFDEKWWILNHLEEAISEDRLNAHFQPQFALDTMECIGYEALARWETQSAGFIAPDKFIPLAEKYGLIESLGLCIAKRALQALPHLPAPQLAINISPLQLQNVNFPMELMELLEQQNISVDQVELELTESTMMDSNLIAGVEHLMVQGFKIAIDDFGTGYSNLSLLTRLPFAKVKIDRTLINEIHLSLKAEALVASIVSFSNKVGFRVLAEGVEYPEQAEKLKAIGVDEVQGYLFGKPRPLSDIRADN